MRRSLVWTLVATAALSAAALLSNEAPRVVSAIEPGLRQHAQSLELPTTSTLETLASLPPLPAQLPALTLEPSKRDVFIPVPVSAPPPAAVQVALQVAPTPPLPVAAPQPPPMQLRYLGTMLDPSGQRLVYLSRGDTAVLVDAGVRLDEGYVVESIEPNSVVLVYPPLSARATIPIPPAPQQQ